MKAIKFTVPRALVSHSGIPTFMICIGIFNLLEHLSNKLILPEHLLSHDEQDDLVMIPEAGIVKMRDRE